MPKPLSQLFAEFPFEFSPLDADPPITDVTGDSRQVRPGALFVAIQGGSFDGHRFIPEAVNRGAAAVVGSQPAPSGLGVPYVRVGNSRQALAYLVAALHDYPARQMTMIGVTGTDGKTTTTNLLYQILKTAGLKVGMISTVNAVIGDRALDTGFHVTTPDAPEVQRYLAMMHAAGLTHAVLETTSHGWAQYRVDACEFDLAVVTNITHEHLNDHGSLENYRAAKARLFESLALTRPKPQGNPRLAVLNRDDSSHDYLLDRIPGLRHVSYGLGGEADVRAENIEYLPSGIRFDAVGDGWDVPVTCQLVGAFNVSNALAALTAAVRGLGLDPVTAAQGIAELTGIPGRMERIDLGQPFTAIVDFAHTPNALKVAIQAARGMLHAAPLTPNTGNASVQNPPRVIVTFGSAGLRDKEKRRMMAETAAELADIAILTAEDPRTESLDGILDEMAAGARSRGGVEGKTFFRIPDRAEAIRFMLRIAREGDIVMACGKGHEQSMCFGKVEHPWDDRTAMRAALAELLGVDGPEMPYLPTQDTPEAVWLQAA